MTATVTEVPIVAPAGIDPQRVAFAERLAIRQYANWFAHLPEAAQALYARGEALPYVGPALTGARIGASWLWKRIQGLARMIGRGGLLALAGLAISTEDGQRMLVGAADLVTRPFRWAASKVLNGIDRVLGWLGLTGARDSLQRARLSGNARIARIGAALVTRFGPWVDPSSKPMSVVKAVSAGYLIAKAVSFIPGPIGTIGQVVVLGVMAYRIITRLFRGSATADALSQVPGAVRADMASTVQAAADQVAEAPTPGNRSERRAAGERGQHRQGQAASATV